MVHEKESVGDRFKNRLNKIPKSVPIIILIALAAFFLLVFLQSPLEEITGKAVDMGKIISQNEYNIFVSLEGDDSWSGLLPEPDFEGNDGPFATLERARDAVRELKQQGNFNKPVNIYIRGGTYYLTQTFKLNTEDSGTENYPITYENYLGEKVVISGGRRLEPNWQPYDNGIYVADVSLDFSSLFVNGKRAVRAREPNEVFYYIKSVDTGPTNITAFRFYEGDISPDWRNLNEVEVVSYRRWEQSRFRIASVVDDKVYFQGSLNPAKGYDWDYNTNPRSRYYVENVFEGLDTPGEWYLDKPKGKLYYMPLSGEDLGSSEFVAPVLQQILKVNGIVKTPYSDGSVNYVNIKGISFEHSDFTLPANGYAGGQAGMYIATPEAVMFNHTLNCSFTNNKIAHTGAYAISSYSIKTKIDSNEIFDAGAGGIKIGNEKDTTYHNSNTVTNNKIHDNNAVYKEGVGILLGITGHNKVSHNLIYNMPYSGISLGWKWSIKKSSAKNNTISYNIVHNVMQELNDGAGIYTLGNQSGSKIENNIIHDIKKTEKHTSNFSLNGIYFDQGSSFMLIKNNLVYSTRGSSIKLHKTFFNRIENNILIDGNAVLDLPNGRIPVDGLLPQGDLFLRNIAYCNTNCTTFDSVYIRHSISVSDYNLYFTKQENPNWNLDLWKSIYGLDQNSLTAYPLFKDYQNDEFSLREQSPAFALGFAQIDLSTTGPQVECFDDVDCAVGQMCSQNECVQLYPYVLFSKSVFEPVFSDTVPNSSEIISEGGEIRTFAAKGETEPITFSVRSNVDLGEVQIEVSDLRQGDLIIPKENIEVLNIKIWPQCGPKNKATTSGNWHVNCNNPNITMSYDVPELLVKDNEQDLAAEEIGWVPSEGKYYPPTANENFHAIVRQDSTHTFYISIKVPKDASPGNYQATVTFRPEQAEAQQFNLEVQVLPFELPDPEKEILAFTTQQVSGNYQNGFSNLGREKYEQYLDFLKENGLTSLLITGTGDLEWIAQKMEEKGFKGTFIWRPQGGNYYNVSFLSQNIENIKKYGFDVYVYGSDEPNSPASMVYQLKYSESVHDAGGKITTAILRQCAAYITYPDCPIYDLANVAPVQITDMPIYGIGGGNTSRLGCGFYSSWYFSIYNKKVFFSPWIDGVQTYQQGSKIVSPDVWHHVAIVWNGTSGRYQTYLDGQIDVNALKPGKKLPANMEELIIGAMDKKAQYPFKGEIDELKIYNRSLTKEEIDSGVLNPAAYYKFDEGSGSSTYDTSGNQNNCQINGAVWVDGKNNKALGFDGVDDYLNCGNGTLGISNAITVDAWVNLPSGYSNSHQMIVGKMGEPSRQLIETYIAGLQNGTIEKNPYKEFYYFQIWPEPGRWELWANIMPQYQRVLTGFFLYNTGLDGISPYGLDSMYLSHGYKIYNDSDVASKEWRSIYPTTQGWVKTIEFEAFREGIDDLRYLTKFDLVLGELKQKDPSRAMKIQNEVDDRLKMYRFYGADGNNPWDLPEETHQENRKFIADKIIEVQNILNESTEPICGNGICEDGENLDNCFEDCYSPGKNPRKVLFQSEGFEDGLGNWTNVLELDSTEAASGQYSGRFAMQSNQTKYLTNYIELEPGKKTIVSIDLKYEDLECQQDKECEVLIQVQELDAWKNHIRNSYPGSSSFVYFYTGQFPRNIIFRNRNWTNFKYSFVTHPNTRYIRLTAKTSGNFLIELKEWLDNLMIFQSDKQAGKETVSLPGDPCSYGMCVEGISEHEDAIEITTTGALFKVNKNLNQIELYQRIMGDEIVQPVFRGTATFDFDFSSLNIEEQNNNVVVLSDSQHWLAFHADSAVFFASQPSVSVTINGKLKPEYQVFFKCNNLTTNQTKYGCGKENVVGGNLVVFDKKGDGGIGITPAPEKGEINFVEIQSSENFTDIFNNEEWDIKYNFAPNHAGVISVFPPKKFDWNKYCEEKTWMSGVCNISENLTVQCPSDEVIESWKEYSPNMLWFGPWVYEGLAPAVLEFGERIHEKDMKLILYASPQWPYSRSVTSLNNLFNTLKTDFNADGFYIDEMYLRQPYSPSPVEDWAWLRHARQVAGNGPIILHHSRSFMPVGRRYASNDYNSYYPFVFAYADYGFVTESISIKGLELDNDYLTFFVSQYGISNIIESPKINCFNRAGANFENLKRLCMGYTDEDRQNAFTMRQLIDKIVDLNASMKLSWPGTNNTPSIESGNRTDMSYFFEKVNQKCEAIKYCGNSKCEQGESWSNCEEDCGVYPPVCGNSIVETGEECDGTNLSGKSCAALGFDSGSLSCNSNCTFNETACYDFACGNSIMEGTEVCDGTSLAGKTCVSLGYENGTLACLDNCTGYNTSSCVSNPVCGDSIVETGEECDGTNLSGKSCVALGFDSGSLSCNSNCTFNETACYDFACGNSIMEGTEVCDGTSLAGKTCVSLGYENGTLACLDNCTGYNTSSCVSNPVCGNGVCETGEDCSTCSQDCGGCGGGGGGGRGGGTRDRCKDRIENQDETDVDCGGRCSPCDNGLRCVDNSDCITYWCYNRICRAASCFDNIKNQGEEDTDCGGPCPICLTGYDLFKNKEELSSNESICTDCMEEKELNITESQEPVEKQGKGFIIALIVSIFIASSAIALVIISAVRKREFLQARSEQREQEIIQWIRRRKKEGYSEEQIKQALIQAGWSREATEELFMGL